MLRLLFLISTLGVVSPLSFPFHCTKRGSTIQHGDIYLTEGCSVARTCIIGQLVYKRDYACPIFTICVRENRILKCVVPRPCYRLWNRIAHGSLFVSAECTSTKTCYNGRLINQQPYSCPTGTRCATFGGIGNCVDQPTTTTTTTTPPPPTTTIEPTTTPIIDNSCDLPNGMTLESGLELLDEDCRTRYTCDMGDWSKHPHHCTAGYRCQGGNTCAQIGLTTTVEPSPTPSIPCDLPNGMTLESGLELLDEDCRTRYTCDMGDWSKHPHHCPSGHRCQGGDTCAQIG